MVARKHTPMLEAGTKRGGKVNAIPSRPLGNLEFAKLNELLVDYEKKWADMGPMGQAPCKHMKAARHVSFMRKESSAALRRSVALMRERRSSAF